MAKLLLKLQRYFRRKPVRFFSFIILYLTAGSLAFLHSSFAGESTETSKEPVAVETINGALVTQNPGLIGRVFKETPKPSRRYGPPWLKPASKDPSERGRAGSWSRALKGRSTRDQEESRELCAGVCNTEQDYGSGGLHKALGLAAALGQPELPDVSGLEFGAECYCGHRIQAPNASESDCNMECKGEKNNMCGGANRLTIFRLELSQESARRYGSAIFKGCFRKPDNVSFALPVSALIPNMTVDKCVDFCTEKEYSLAVLAGQTCHCGFPTLRFPLHEREDEQLCSQRCSGEEFESCGNEDYFVVYQTQLIALASFPGAGNTWARHLIELATGYYTGSYYFDGSLYNKGEEELAQGFKGERDHWRSGRTICIKTHESGRKEIESYDSGILMIRNPYKALMAEFNRKYGGHIGFASQAHWKGKEWPEFVKNYAPWWVSHTLDWLKYGRNVKVIHFEDLKHHLFSQMKKMVSYLGLEVSEDRLLCVEGQKDGNFKRSGLRKLEYDPYTPEMRRMIDGFIKKVDEALKMKNQTGVPEDYIPR
ncbi:UNVERIFIED_CONTAM: hypothetical protein FKN15_056063 [Acipenser sinensis]